MIDFCYVQMREVILRVMVFGALTGSLAIQPANALPFNKDQQSFTKWMNQLNWSDGVKRTFFNLQACRYVDGRGYDFPPYEWYICNSGYVKVFDPRGVQVCKLTSTTQGSAVQYEKYFATNKSKNSFNIYDRDEDCRYVN